jgi:hypothetical protein
LSAVLDVAFAGDDEPLALHDRPDAQDIIHTPMSPELHHILTAERRWSASRYEQWLACTLAAVLLPANAGPSAARPRTRPGPRRTGTPNIDACGLASLRVQLGHLADGRCALRDEPACR